jgi:hypothetical protein
MLKYGTETRPIIRKYIWKLSATEVGYTRRLTRMSRIDNIVHERVQMWD